MKKFKLYDTWISILLIVGFTIVSLVKLDYTFIIGYFVVGGWQVISMIVHAINSWFTKKGSVRYNYHYLVAIIFLLAAVGLLAHALLIVVLPILLFTAPIMAIYYTLLCYTEVYEKMQRPLAILK